MDNWWLFFAVGFVAQLVDGALGMAYGVLTNTALLAIGLPPAHASALVHTTEIFTTSASACLGSVECRSQRRAPVCLRLFVDNGILYSLEVDASRIGIAKSRGLDFGARVWRGISRRDRRWRLGTDDNINARGVRARAALLSRLSQYG